MPAHRGTKNLQVFFEVFEDQSTDLINAAHLMVFIRYSYDGKLHEEVLLSARRKVYRWWHL